MSGLFLIAPGTRPPFGNLNRLRRGQQLAKSRVFRRQMQLLRRRGARRRGLPVLSSTLANGIVSTLPTQDSVIDLLRGFDAGMHKPWEQILLEFWDWRRHKIPRRFARMP